MPKGEKIREIRGVNWSILFDWTSLLQLQIFMFRSDESVSCEFVSMSASSKLFLSCNNATSLSVVASDVNMYL